MSPLWRVLMARSFLGAWTQHESIRQDDASVSLYPQPPPSHFTHHSPHQCTSPWQRLVHIPPCDCGFLWSSTKLTLFRVLASQSGGGNDLVRNTLGQSNFLSLAYSKKWLNVSNVSIHSFNHPPLAYAFTGSQERRSHEGRLHPGQFISLSHGHT